MLTGLQIVDDASSSLDHPVERKDIINANHMMMCRFKSFDDEGYVRVKGVISKYLAEIRDTHLQERHNMYRASDMRSLESIELSLTREQGLIKSIRSY